MADVVLDPKKYEGHTPGPWNLNKWPIENGEWTYSIEYSRVVALKGLGAVTHGSTVFDGAIPPSPADEALISDAPAILAEAIALQARVESLEAEQRDTWLSIVDLLVTELESEHGATHETWFIIEQAKALITKHREADQ